MKTLAIISQKGGSGKTTIAVHMAVCAVRQGYHTAIIDIDPQGSAIDWYLSREQQHELNAVQADADRLPVLLQQAKTGGADFVIVDTAPHSNSAAAIVARNADFILMPCRPSRFDLKAIGSTAAIAQLAKTPAAAIINAAPRGKLSEEAKEALRQQGIDVLDPVLQQRAAFTHAVIDGRSVHEYEPEGKAAGEIDELFACLKKAIKL